MRRRRPYATHYSHDAGGANVCALLDTIARAEIGQAMLAASDDGYDVLVGLTSSDINLFSSYADHPLLSDDDAVEYADGIYSTAAGRYQILNTYWPHYCELLGPEPQDRYAIQQLCEQDALELTQAGRFGDAITAASNIWASMLGAEYGQPELDTLAKVYVESGGQLSGKDRDWYDSVARRLPTRGVVSMSEVAATSDQLDRIEQGLVDLRELNTQILDQLTRVEERQDNHAADLEKVEARIDELSKKVHRLEGRCGCGRCNKPAAPQSVIWSLRRRLTIGLLLLGAALDGWKSVNRAHQGAMMN